MQHVLLVEDDALMRKSLACALQQAGWGVTVSPAARKGRFRFADGGTLFR